MRREIRQAKVFTLQWHITNKCDLACKHCYDRRKLSPLTFKQGVSALEGLLYFCAMKRVKGSVCFTGGNPFLHPNFFKLYQEAVDLGFSISILGNPVPRIHLEKILKIHKPRYFQVSLEGLEEHNDKIRGRGSYSRAFKFLKLLKEMDISSAVMLTLTKDNINQIIPLSEKLKGYADCFTFNRLSCVGEGATLSLPNKSKYKKFLQKWVLAEKKNPIITHKDNLINIVLHQKGEELFDGCTGFGCGAAFNFLALLPDGGVHACRKFPSPLGNIFKHRLIDIYDSDLAKRYRAGSSACNDCKIRHVCGGCLASSYSLGNDIFKEKDPFCFM